MNEQEALSRMISPGQPRNTKRNEGVIQIHVTRACDKACFNCTQGSNLRGPTHHMTPDQFEQAVLSLKDYFGTVGVFGGNPAVSPYFVDYCEILKKHIPFERRGLWCNNPLGKGVYMRGVFNPRVSNLNCHLDKKAYAEFKRDWPESMPFGHDKDSRHSPVFVAMKDVLKKPCSCVTNSSGEVTGPAIRVCDTCDSTGYVYDEEKAWELISDCDINKYWSAMIGLFRGELRAWFCEIAGAQSILHQDDPDYPDTGFPLWIPSEFTTDGKAGEIQHAKLRPWWNWPMEAYASQVRKHCHECSVPLRGYGELACSPDPNSREQTSETHADVYQPKKKERPVQIVATLEELNSKALMFTQYLQGASK